MSEHLKRVSMESSFISYSSQNEQTTQDLPWLCMWCGPNPRGNEGVTNMKTKEKINISKIVKSKKNKEMKSSGSSQAGFSSNLKSGLSMLQSSKSQNDLKNTRKTVATTQDKYLSINQSLRTIESSNMLSSQAFMKEGKNYLPTENHQTRYSLNNYHKTIAYQNYVQPLNQTTKNIIFTGTNHLNQNVYPRVTETPRIEFYSKVVDRGTLYQPPCQQKTPEVSKLDQYRPRVLQVCNNNVILTQCESKQFMELRNQAQINTKNNQSCLSTEQQIPSTACFKLTVSLEQPKQIKISHKKKSSRLAKSPKLFRNIKKVPSRTESSGNNLSSNLFESSSNYTHFGSKIKIGIRKVQSFQSDSQDEYSEVISQAGPNFHMHEIHEVEEASRISSRSTFKNQQDDQLTHKI